MARKEFVRRLCNPSPICSKGGSPVGVVRLDDLKRLVREYEQISEALLALEYDVRHGLLPHPEIPGVTKLPRDVQLAVKLLRPQKRSKS